MLGNFSFGDYFKADAIALPGSWSRTGQGYGLDPERLWATVYTDDDEAARLWERHLPQERILRFGEKDNFWAMGDTGPCGPCSEIHYDRGADLAEQHGRSVNGPGDDTLEIWNLVFMQFERDASGAMTPLPKPSVDTGAGLERITAILQGANNNFDTDLFRPILAGSRSSPDRRTAAGWPGGRAVSRHRGPRARGDDADRRRRAALQRGPRLRAAPHPPPGPALRAAAGARAAVSRADSRRRARGLRRASTSSRRTGDVGRAIAATRVRARRGAVRPDPDRGHRPHRGGDRGPAAASETASRAPPCSASTTRMASPSTSSRTSPGTRASRSTARASTPPGGAAHALRVLGGLRGGRRDGLCEKLGLPERHSEFRGYPEQDFVRLEGRAGPRARSARASLVAELAVGQEGEAVSDRTIFYPEGGGQVGDGARGAGRRRSAMCSTRKSRCRA